MQQRTRERVASWIEGMLVILILATPPLALHAAPFVPERGDMVLEVLPESIRRAASDELRRARTVDPMRAGASAPIAAERAWRLIAMARIEEDPRLYGWAEGLISPWAARSDAPAEILLVRATLRQHRHAFDEAREDLNRVLARDPGQAQAWLTLAVIEMVQGEIEAARRSCGALLSLGNRLTAMTCLAQLGGLTGRADRSRALLDHALAAAQDAQAMRVRHDSEPGAPERRTSSMRAGSAEAIDEQVFALSVLGDLAARRGLEREADRYFERGLELAPNDPQLLGARADLALDCGRPERVIDWLADRTRHDGLLLRLALAEHQLGRPAARAHQAELAARFAAAARRGERLHLGEEARFRLELELDPIGALRLAEENWRVQREPIDARILVAAALASDAPERAAPVRAHRARTGLEDIGLDRLFSRLDEAER